VTEIQGGSDVPINALRAEPEGDRWRLFGQKWFCSNINADYFLVTGRPAGAPEGGSGVALFLMPAYLDGQAPLRNGYRIERLKDKLGTRELATAEVMFDGALASAVGPLNRGISTVLRYVLSTSRFACASVAASTLRQAERLVSAYSEFRSVFGLRLTDYPLVQAQLAELRSARGRTLASLFELLAMWQRSKGSDRSAEGVHFRVLLSLCKAVLTRQATLVVHDAMMLLGGNGIEERFSPMPRLWRDAAIMETWEGPHNLLFTQAWRDLLRFEVSPVEFVSQVAGERRRDLADSLGRILSRGPDLSATVTLAAWGEQLVHALGDRVLGQIGAQP
jgi:alkylation response protein AidB-like acyl-CoA dehydrogenase